MKIVLLVTKIVSLIITGVCSIFLIMWQIAPRDTDELLKKWHIPIKESLVVAIAIIFIIIMFASIYIDDKYFKK